MNRAMRVRVSGPFARYTDGFRTVLAERGYTPSSPQKEHALARNTTQNDTRFDTGHPTRCSPSSKHSDYAEYARGNPLPHKLFSTTLGIIRCSA